MGRQIGAVDPSAQWVSRYLGAMDPTLTFFSLGCFITGSFNIGMFELSKDDLLPFRSGDIECKGEGMHPPPSASRTENTIMTKHTQDSGQRQSIYSLVCV